MRDLIHLNRPFKMPIHQADITSVFDTLQTEVNRLFDRFYNGTMVHLTDWDQKLPTAPAIDIMDTGKAFKVKVELAGMDPENVNLEVTNGVLTIKGEKKEEKKEESENLLRQEIVYGSFYRAITLPDAADTAKADAKYKSGVLTIEVPKKTGAIESSRKLQIKKAA